MHAIPIFQGQNQQNFVHLLLFFTKLIHRYLRRPAFTELGAYFELFFYYQPKWLLVVCWEWFLCSPPHMTLRSQSLTLTLVNNLILKILSPWDLWNANVAKIGTLMLRNFPTYNLLVCPWLCWFVLVDTFIDRAVVTPFVASPQQARCFQQKCPGNGNCAGPILRRWLFHSC